MHESTVMKGLMSKIEELALANKSSKVTGVHVKLGALSSFSEDHFQEHFELAAKGGIADGAKLFLTMDQDITSPSAQNVLLEEIDLERF